MSFPGLRIKGNQIEPDKWTIEGLEVLSFETEDQLNLYSVWHDALHGKWRISKAESERERQSIRNELTRRQFVTIVGQPAEKPAIPNSRPTGPTVQSANLPNGLTILNSVQFNTLPSGKQMMKYKLTKLYNKYRGRQVRRNFVNEKQRNARIELEVAKSYLNSWLAYTALQALCLPESNYPSLNTTTTSHSKILAPLPQPSLITTPAATATKKSKTSKAKQPPQQSISSPQKPPMHLVYIDPGNIITYSNRINPQQVAEYKQKSHLLPSSATSKKSSAASYDVYEIMEVLANTNKTNVTITRNANRPCPTGPANSIYSHSVNANTPGIVSTQLHLQARSYLDSMSKFYAEEAQRLKQQEEELKHEPEYDKLIGKYLHLS